MIKFVLLSDTHGFKPDVPNGDFLIFAGDWSQGWGKEMNHVVEFSNWIGNLPHSYKIVIAGNHDIIAEHKSMEVRQEFARRDIIYLQHEKREIAGIKFFGSPYTPRFAGCFMADRGRDLANLWERIPDNTDILITHGPPFKVLDETFDGEKSGCVDLWYRLWDVRPKLHVFGHIHEGYGNKTHLTTSFYNASICNEFYEPINKPHVWYLN